MEKCSVFLYLTLACLLHSSHSEVTHLLNSDIITTENEKLNWITEQKLSQTSTPELSQHTQVSDSLHTNDPMQSKICSKCRCEEGSAPFVIDCQQQGLEDYFPLLAEWPHDVLISSIDVRFDSNEYKEVRKLPELPLLRLSYRANRIDYIEKTAFKYLKSLEYLDLSENKLTHESLRASIFEGPFNDEDYEPIPLKTLKLGYNQITSIDKEAFDHLTHLETLELNNNPLRVIDHQTAMAITTLKKLKTLNLAETDLTSIPSPFFNPLRALKVLILSGNKFNFVPQALEHAVNLEHLNLNNNPIRNFVQMSFNGLNNLKTLNISSMPVLESIGSNTFTSLSSLIHLWCSYNPLLTRIHSGAFNNMEESDNTFQLQEFHFRGNGVRRIPFSLLPWSTLQLIDIGENPFYCDCSIKLIVTEVIPLIQESSLDLTASIQCAGPSDYANRTLESLANDPNIVNCSADPNGPSEHDDEHHEFNGAPTSSSKGLVIASVFGIFLVMGGMTCFVLMALRKSNLRELYDTSTGQIVHYVRTAGGSGKADDEHAIVEKEFNEFSEDP